MNRDGTIRLSKKEEKNDIGTVCGPITTNVIIYQRGKMLIIVIESTNRIC